jgi:hypothetical protein
MRKKEKCENPNLKRIVGARTYAQRRGFNQGRRAMFREEKERDRKISSITGII